MEDLELSFPIAGSGKFIELYHTGALQEAQPLWVKCCRLRTDLEAVRAKLCKCNDSVWLFQFLETCRRQKRDFEQQLRKFTRDLENTKRSLEEQIARIYLKLEDVDPCLSQAAHTLAEARIVQLKFYFVKNFAAKSCEVPLSECGFLRFGRDGTAHNHAAGSALDHDVNKARSQGKAVQAGH